jgi:hypothetical protein
MCIAHDHLNLTCVHVQAYKKEYGKQVEGRVNVQSLTGAPYTVVNKVRVGRRVREDIKCVTLLFFPPSLSSLERVVPCLCSPAPP